jgi:hypothetical protein
MPLYVSNVLSASTLTAGLVTSFIGIGLAVGGVVNARLPADANERAVLGSIAIQGAGYGALIVLAHDDVSAWTSAPALTAIGFGWGVAYARLVSLMLSDVPKSQAGVASGAGQMGRQVGGAVATALAVAVVFTLERDDIGALDIAQLPETEVRELESALRLRHALTPELTGIPTTQGVSEQTGVADGPLRTAEQAADTAVDETGAAEVVRQVRVAMFRSVEVVFGLGILIVVLSLVAALRLMAALRVRRLSETSAS